jgi:hypothetical protein
MSSLHIKPIKDAAALLGGSAALGCYLRVPVGEVDAWLEGRTEPPHGMLGEAIYLVRELTRPRVAVIPEAPPAG